MRDEGVIKFACRWMSADPLEDSAIIRSLMHYRQLLFKDELIGVYPDGIGYGNLSARTGERQFIISGSQTGNLSELSVNDFAEVIDYDVPQNWISCHGKAQASSESLTHAMIYEIFPNANAVLHVHNNEAWRALQGKVPTTKPEAPYGTPDMADEIRRLSNDSDVAVQKMIVMAGHEDGIVSFGSTLQEAYDILMRHLRTSVSR